MYEELAFKVKQLIEGILKEESIKAVKIEARAKEIDSFKEKLTRLNINPKEMQDLAGIRIIGKIHSDVIKIKEIIQRTFEVDPKRSIDKLEVLGKDKVGYQSIHIIAALTKDRLSMPEYKKFKDLYFEIQIRTALQHAWAEVAHDRSYKFGGKLPEKIERRLNLVAGALEILDNEFERTSNDIEKYKEDVTTKTKQGNLDIPINSTSLKEYLIERFKNFNIIPEYGVTSAGVEEIRDLNTLGITKLEGIEKIIPDEGYLTKILAKRFNQSNQANLTALIRIILLKHFGKEFFTKAYPPNTFDDKWITQLLKDFEIQ